MKNIRKLKIEGKWRANRWSAGQVPKIMLTGKWLAAAGFGTGQHVEIAVEAGRLTLRPLAGR